MLNTLANELNIHKLARQLVATGKIPEFGYIQNQRVFPLSH